MAVTLIPNKALGPIHSYAKANALGCELVKMWDRQDPALVTIAEAIALNGGLGVVYVPSGPLVEIGLVVHVVGERIALVTGIWVNEKTFKGGYVNIPIMVEYVTDRALKGRRGHGYLSVGDVTISNKKKASLAGLGDYAYCVRGSVYLGYVSAVDEHGIAKTIDGPRGIGYAASSVGPRWFRLDGFDEEAKALIESGRIQFAGLGAMFSRLRHIKLKGTLGADYDGHSED